MSHKFHPRFSSSISRPSSFLFRGMWFALILSFATTAGSQEEEGEVPPVQGPAEATVGASIDPDGTGRIVVEARGELPKPAVFYRTTIDNRVSVARERMNYEAEFVVEILQGEAGEVSYWLRGLDEITGVTGETVSDWSIRWDSEKRRFLDVSFKEGLERHEFVVRMRSEKLKLPSVRQVLNFAPFGGESAGLSQIVSLSYAPEVIGRLTDISGFLPVTQKEGEPRRYQTQIGGKFLVAIDRVGTSPERVELSACSLEGNFRGSEESGAFTLKGVATVREPGASIPILQGRAAVSRVPASVHYRLQLTHEGGRPVFRLHFPEPGVFPIAIDFVASSEASGEGWRQVDFKVGAGAVVPVYLEGLESDREFAADPGAVVPEWKEGAWLGFLPASGRANFAWKRARQTGKGKLFFTTTAMIHSQVGAGLLRQDHQISYRILQGQLDSLAMGLDGEGEILEVIGQNITGWKVEDTGAGRRLQVSLSQPVEEGAQLRIRSQTAFGAFPVAVGGIRLTPVGAVRHSGYLRLSNLGSVRLEPTELSGLTQLAPEQYPGDAIEARQIFVYRFPAAEYGLEIQADRVQPEVGVSQVVRYQVTETDRIIAADIELDIREASIREWEVEIPEDYSPVSVTGSGVGDYLVGSEVVDGRRSLNVIFSEEVAGRQLLSLVLEKNQVAVAGDWTLPALVFPEARSVRGDVGVVGVPGIRVGVGETDLLVEKPLSYFPAPEVNLQQAFRIREPGWSATMAIELLEQSVQADVFHLYSLSEGTAFASAVLNFYVTGSPVSEWELMVPEDLDNVMVDGKEVRTWRREGTTLIVSLHQPIIGPYTLLVTSEEKLGIDGATLSAGRITPLGVQGERGFVQVVSPVQVKVTPSVTSDGLLQLDPLELPAEFRLLSAAPALGTWQYTSRPFELAVDVDWYEAGATVSQVVEFSEVHSRVSPDGELVTDAVYYVKSRGRPVLSVSLPPDVRLWEVSVQGRPVTARQAEDITLIPLPGSADPDLPVEVVLRLGRPAVDGKSPVITLPRISAPILKTEWRVSGDDKHVLVPVGGNVRPPEPVLPPTGFTRLVDQGIGKLFALLALALLGAGMSLSSGRGRNLAALIVLILSVLGGLYLAFDERAEFEPSEPLQFSLPIQAPDQRVEFEVQSLAPWQTEISILGLVIGLAGLVMVIASHLEVGGERRRWIRALGWIMLLVSPLLQRGGTAGFYLLLVVVILLRWLVPIIVDLVRSRKSKGPGGDGSADGDTPRDPQGAPSTASALIVAGSLAAGAWFPGSTQAAESEPTPAGFLVAESIAQEWNLRSGEKRIQAKGLVKFTAEPGESFLLLKSPAVLVDFKGEGLEVTKRKLAEAGGDVYLVNVPENPFEGRKQYEASFEYLMESGDLMGGLPILTGSAAIQELKVSYDQAGREFSSAAAIRVTSLPSETGSAASLLLAPGDQISIALRPKARDVMAEETRFYIESSNLYLPAPGVVDGRHRIQVRPSQGAVREMIVQIPGGLTVSEVDGPIGSWEFDADSGQLVLAVEPAQADPFAIAIETQRGLDPLPTDLSLAPLMVEGASGQVGLVGLAFGADAQPEKVEASGMSMVNLGDFDPSLLPSEAFVLHRVFRYGREGGELSLRVASVSPEVRVNSRQVLSFGDERVILSVNFAAEIIRAGLFQVSFPLPDGLEVESLSGSALHHFSELTVDGQRQVVLHLNGKTLGVHEFSLVLAGLAPSSAEDWVIPRFSINEATRQTGDLVVKPTTGIRLRTIDRQNVSELDPRQLGGGALGALAFKLLQGDWSLVLGIEKLEPWVTGQLLHSVTLREGQTRTQLVADLSVENASIRSMPIRLPLSDPDEIKTLRASGPAVSDLVRTSPDSDLWEVQFKRRIVGEVEVRIEFERRGERTDELERLAPVALPTIRQLNYYLGVRTSGRLELATRSLPAGWQPVDWNSVPSVLKEASGNPGAPAIALRSITPEFGQLIDIEARRHALAEALKLRVANGNLTTVLSPMGDELTAVDLVVEVVQRSSLAVALPAGGELFSVFVNGESVHSVRAGDAWQFYILPGADESTAQVRFIYGLSRDHLRHLELSGPRLNVPLENISWRVLAPEGYRMVDAEGTLEPLTEEVWQKFDRRHYLAKVKGARESQAQQAAELLEQANQLIQAGDQTRARWALSSVANQHALDAASNEDARIQLENLQTQQAIVGLNTRRQRLFLDHTVDEAIEAEAQQYQQGAAANPILQQGELNFRPQELSQLLQGNTNEDNRVLRRLAERLVRQQGSAEPAPRAIRITLPEEGRVYTFERAVQVAENAPLDLELRFERLDRTGAGSVILAMALIAMFGIGVVFLRRAKDSTPDVNT